MIYQLFQLLAPLSAEENKLFDFFFFCSVLFCFVLCVSIWCSQYRSFAPNPTLFFSSMSLEEIDQSKQRWHISFTCCRYWPSTFWKNEWWLKWIRMTRYDRDECIICLAVSLFIDEMIIFTNALSPCTLSAINQFLLNVKWCKKSSMACSIIFIITVIAVLIRDLLWVGFTLMDLL